MPPKWRAFCSRQDRRSAPLTRPARSKHTSRLFRPEGRFRLPADALRVCARFLRLARPLCRYASPAQPSTIHSMSSALPSYDEAAALVAAYAAQLGRTPAVRRARRTWPAAGRVLARPCAPTAISRPLPAPRATDLPAVPRRPRRTCRLPIAGATRAGEAPARTAAARRGMGDHDRRAGSCRRRRRDDAGARREQHGGHSPPAAAAHRRAQARTSWPRARRRARAMSCLPAGTRDRRLRRWLWPQPAAAPPSRSSPGRAWPFSPLATSLCRSIGARPRPDSQLERAHAGRDGGRGGRRALDLPTAADNARALDAALAASRRGRSAAHHRRRFGGQVRPGRAGAGARRARASTSPACAFSRASRWSLARSASQAKRAKRSQASACRCFFGLPGNPVSSAVTFLLFAAPVLAALAGRRELGPRFALARLAADVESQKPGLTRFLARLVHLQPRRRQIARSCAGSMAGLRRSGRAGPLQLLSGRARRRRSASKRARSSAFCLPEEFHAQ